MEKIVTNAAPAPAGHYSQAIRHNGLVFVSGQLPLDPVSKEVVEGGIERARLCLDRGAEGVCSLYG